MIRLTSFHNNEPVWINPDLSFYVNVTANYHGQKATSVCSGNTLIQVQESPEEVARKVLEWRLAMDRYRAYVNAAALDEKPQSNECWELAANAKAELVRLAGLEEPNHDT